MNELYDDFDDDEYRKIEIKESEYYRDQHRQAEERYRKLVEKKAPVFSFDPELLMRKNANYSGNTAQAEEGTAQEISETPEAAEIPEIPEIPEAEPENVPEAAEEAETEPEIKVPEKSYRSAEQEVIGLLEKYKAERPAEYKEPENTEELPQEEAPAEPEEAEKPEKDDEAEKTEDTGEAEPAVAVPVENADAVNDEKNNAPAEKAPGKSATVISAAAVIVIAAAVTAMIWM